MTTLSIPSYTIGSIKRPGHNDGLDDWQVAEIERCFRDPEYFIEHYVYIQSSGSVLFKLYPYQRRVLYDFIHHPFSIILQGRQTGKTILIIAYLIWLACFRSNQIIGIAAHKDSGAIELIKRFQYAYEYLPQWLKPGVTEYNKHEVAFDNDSRIISQATTEKTFRGLSLTALMLDELAFVPPRIAQDFWTAILPTLTQGGFQERRVIITSTPNSSEGLFADLWFQAEQGESLFHAIKVNYEEIPSRDQAFKDQMLTAMTENKFNQEFLCHFISDKGTLIHSKILENLRPAQPIETIQDIDFYEEVNNQPLLVAIDVAEGIAQDYSTVEIFNRNTLNQVGEFRSNTLNLSDFAIKVLSILVMLRHKRCSELHYTIEANPIGVGLIELVQKSDHSILLTAELVSAKKKKGIPMTSVSKAQGCSLFKDLIENQKMTLRSKALLSELKFFVKRGISFAAESGKHDDLVMACVLVSLMLKRLARSHEDVHDRLQESVSTHIEQTDLDRSEPMPVLFY